MEKKKLTVTIGIPVYNEENNIRKLLESLCNQKERSIKIRGIIVISDGSTDKTVGKAGMVKDKRIRIIAYKQRRGKPTRLNKLFRVVKDDILVIVDSDSILKDKYVIDTLLGRFKKYKNVGIIAGNPLPLSPKSFLESAINNYIWARHFLSDKFQYEKSAYIARGFIAYSYELLSELSFPNNILNEDTYSYFYCITHDFKILYEKNAIVYFRSSQTIKDFINQAVRHNSGGFQLKKYFPQDLVDRKFTLPPSILLKILIYQLFKNPFGYIFLKLLNLFSKYKSLRMYKRINVKWQRINSTKIFIS